LNSEMIAVMVVIGAFAGKGLDFAKQVA